MVMAKDIISSVQLDEVVKKTIDSLEKGKEQIFQIAEEASSQWHELENKLSDLQKKVSITIQETEQLEKFEKDSRKHLMQVSKDFKDHSEDDIKKAYETTRDLQVKLALKREQEQQLISQRTEVELQIRKVITTVKRAEYLVGHVAVAMNYLTNTLVNISDTLEDLQKKELFGVKIIMAQEEERQRVARDIHDGPAQSLSNIVLKCEICEKLFTMDTHKAGNEIKEIKQLVRWSLQEIRRIIFDLRPMSLDDLGLIPTLQQYIYNFEEQTGIEVVLNCYDSEYVKIESVVEVAVFRIIQEALNNIKKHSKADRVVINLAIKDNMMIGTIADNGIGFNTDEVEKSRPNTPQDGGLGIMGMRQRAELLKGKLNITSEVGKNTVINLQIPISLTGSNDEEEQHGQDNCDSSR